MAVAVGSAGGGVGGFSPKLANSTLAFVRRP